jgi:hypothetical protein
MSINEERGSIISSSLSDALRQVLFYFCVENLRLKRIGAGKNFGKTFLQKGIAKMQESGIPLLNYLFTQDRVACEFSPDLDLDYNQLQKALQKGGLNRSHELLEDAREFIGREFDPEVCRKIDQIADSLKDVEVSKLISESHQKDEEVIRRSKLFYLNPNAPAVLGLKELDVEAEIKEKWVESLRKNKPLPTAKPLSIRLGKLPGLVKTTGFLIPVDYLFDRQGSPGRVVSVFNDSRQDINQGCVCFLDRDFITIQALSQYENVLPEGKFLIIGEVVPNAYKNQTFTQSHPEVAGAQFALNALAILQVIIGYHTVITSVEGCVEEIKHYAKRDSHNAFEKLSDLKKGNRRYRPKTVLAKICNFCKYMVKDCEVFPKEHVQPPSETLKIMQGDCKSKVCLAYSMLLHENSVEELNLVLLDTEGTGKPNHVQIEAKIASVSSPITLELTGNSSAFRREVGKFPLPLYTA